MFNFKRISFMKKGSALLVLSVILCGVVAFCGYSMARLTQVTNNSLEANIGMKQAQLLAESELNAVSSVSYSSLAGYSRKAVGSGGLESEVILGTEEDYGTSKKRAVTVNVYKSGDNIPSASFTKTFFKSNPALYNELGNNEDKGVSQKALTTILNDQFYRVSEGEEIPAEADLNDYQKAGSYYSGSYANSSTVKNAPDVSSIAQDGLHSFRLIVRSRSVEDESIVQELRHCTGDIFIRYKINGGEWQSWRHVLDENAADALYGGKPIPANDDLNNYRKPGNYYVFYDKDAITVKNTPIEGNTSAFTMQVRSGGGIVDENSIYSEVTNLDNNVIQELTTWTGNKYFRRYKKTYSTGSAYWDDWQKVLTDKNFATDYIVKSDPGYIKFPNGLVFAWSKIHGYADAGVGDFDTSANVFSVQATKPIPFKTFVAIVSTRDSKNYYWQDYYWYWNQALTTDTTDTFVNYWNRTAKTGHVNGSVFWIGQAVE